MRVIIFLYFLCSITFGSVFASNSYNTEEIVNSKQQIEKIQKHINEVYQKIKNNNAEATTLLDRVAFRNAYWGFLNLKENKLLPKTTTLITICDFNLSANKKRLWVIDLSNNKVLYHSLVSHGKNSGEEFATSFSNTVNSYQSSLGFFVTDTTYFGKNGYSLRLNGMDKGFNCNALERAIVMHGAAYCSEDFIVENQRLGRSYGCPAVPNEIAQELIDVIKEKSCLYIHFDSPSFTSQSVWLNKVPTVVL